MITRRSPTLALALAPALPWLFLLSLTGCGRTGLLSADWGDGGPCSGASCGDGGGGDADGGPRRDGGPDGGRDGGPDGGPDCRLILEDCGNQGDDNCDGLVDCKDPQCTTDLRCGTHGVEICANGVDDDRNGLTDCDDPVCAALPACRPGRVCNPDAPDCNDPVCVDHPACQNLVCKPSVDFGALARNDARSQRAISTVGTRDVARTQCAPPGGGQVVATFEVAADQTSVRLDYAQAMNTDHAFGLYRAGVNQRCEANPIGCFDPKALPAGTNTWVLDRGRYYLIVMAVTPLRQGAIDVTLSTPSSMRKELCANGIDDDGNNLVDCADPTCAADPACAALLCKPDVILGTIVPTDGTPGSGKSTRVSTPGGNTKLALYCGGKGAARVIQFSLAETAGIAMAANQDPGGDHVFGLYRKPPAGKACDAVDTGVCDLVRNNTQYAFGDFAPGDYLLIVQAIKPGDESGVDVTLFAYKNKGVELCQNKIDDDNDGLIDCADPTCANDLGCGPPLCAPDVDFGNLVIDDPPRRASFELAGGVPKLKSTCAMGGGRSRVVQFTMPAFGGVVFGCNEQSGHAVFGLYAPAAPRDSCDVSELSCANPETIPFGCRWEWPSVQPGTYYLIATAFKAGDEGRISIDLSAVMDRALEICSNGMDDDMDGFIDCADLKCRTDPRCTKKACKADVTQDPMPIGQMVQVQLDTRMKAAIATPACQVKPGGGAAAAFLRLPQPATLNVRFAQFGMASHVLALYPASEGLVCDAKPPLACNAAKAIGNTSFAAVPAGAYWLIAAADQPGNEGLILLDLTAVP